MKIMRLWRLLLVPASLLLLVAAPSADVIAFGLHDHVLGAAERSLDPTGTEGTPGQTFSHHCELSVSIGELLPVVELLTPVGIMVDPPEPHASGAQHRPFVPLTPPRA